MKAKPDTLVLFTSEFPCGNGEPFLVNEFEILQKKFKTIFVVPSKFGTVIYNNLGENVKVLNVGSHSFTRSNAAIFLSNFFLVLGVHLKEILISKKRGIFIKHLREYNSYLLNCIRLSERLKLLIRDQNISNAVFYSFWMNESALALAVLKKKAIVDRFIFRANGFDLYDYQTRYNNIPFRTFIFARADKMFAVSKKGSEYMKRIGVNTENIGYSYFGTQDLGISVFDPSKKFTVFTCSDLRRIKRAQKMVDILSHIDEPVKWVHHGDKGDSESVFFEKIKELRPNVEFELQPRKQNYDEVLQFFKNHHFNIFVLLSETEGVPVSLIEAMSFGIPLMATNVGGVSEVINDNNGILLEKDFDPADVAKKLLAFKNSAMNTEAFRKKTREDWEHRFWAKNNYEKFYNEIISIQ